MSTPDLFRDQPVLTSPLVRLEPLTLAVLDDYVAAIGDPDVTRLTGTHARFDRSGIEAWLASRHAQDDRADWAIVRAQDNAFLGEAVLNGFDCENESVNYRVWLAGPRFFGRGYGTETTRLVVDYALLACGLHRVSLGVYDFNSRAQRVYEKCGFKHEGRLRGALSWNGEWHDELLMSILSSDVQSGEGSIESNSPALNADVTPTSSRLPQRNIESE